MEPEGFLPEIFGSEAALPDLTASPMPSVRSELVPDGLHGGSFIPGSSLPHTTPSELPSSSAPLPFDFGDIFSVSTLDDGLARAGNDVDVGMDDFLFPRSPRRPTASFDVGNGYGYLESKYMLKDAIEQAVFDTDLPKFDFVEVESPKTTALKPDSWSEMASSDTTNLSSAMNLVSPILSVLCDLPVSMADGASTTADSPSPLISSTTHGATSSKKAAAGALRGKTASDFDSIGDYEAYAERRKKNNTASRRSRYKNKQRLKETEDEVMELRQENAELRKELRIIAQAFEHLNARLQTQANAKDSASSSV